MSDQDRLLDPAEEALGQISGGSILDVATGNGGFISYLIENLKDYTEITGIDSNQRPLEGARQSHPQENIHFLQMDAVKMDFPDRHFDTVCISNSLHHMVDLPGVLDEMKRVCKPGGYFIISEMFQDGQSEAQLTHVTMHHWWAAVDNAEGITHFETFTRGKIIEITEQLGLHHLRQYELKDLEADPKDPELMRQLGDIIDRYIQRIEKLKDGKALLQRGEELRQRLNEVGFHGATALLLIGQK